jgi:type IV pilus assembly protein PilC
LQQLLGYEKFAITSFYGSFTPLGQNMPSLSSQHNTKRSQRKRQSRSGLAEAQKLAKMKAAEKKAPKTKVKLDDLTIFTQQLSSMLLAGLPLVTAMEALQDQTSDLVFRAIIRQVKLDVASGTPFSEACEKYPKAFPKLFVSMVRAGEASGNLGDILAKTASYFDETVKLNKKVKSALTYPITVIIFSIALVNVLLVFVIPVFAEMFESFGSDLPAPTMALMALSDFLKGYIIYLVFGAFIIWKVIGKFFATPAGRKVKDFLLIKLPIFGELIRKISLSRFCRTFSILMKSGVPILQALEIVASGANNTYIERACLEISRTVSQGGQISEVIGLNPYFPSMIRHMTLAGEQTGEIDNMLVKVSDFYDVEIENTVSSLTSLLEPMLIVFLGVIIGGIVMAMFLPIFQMPTIME